MGLLVTMFLSLTTLLVGSVSQSPSVAEGVNALTAWMMVHYLFILSILLSYSYQLCLLRFLSMEEDNKVDNQAISASIDKWCLIIFLLFYLLSFSSDFFLLFLLIPAKKIFASTFSRLIKVHNPPTLH